MDKSNKQMLRERTKRFDALLDSIANVAECYRNGYLTRQEAATHIRDKASALLEVAYQCRISELALMLEKERFGYVEP